MAAFKNVRASLYVFGMSIPPDGGYGGYVSWPLVNMIGTRTQHPANGDGVSSTLTVGDYRLGKGHRPMGGNTAIKEVSRRWSLSFAPTIALS
ncbi:MAG: hypothetical protein HQK89_08110 [Nitrospirae bacterium]|nr:hypothetical protein [Nitrospirota bacterium]